MLSYLARFLNVLFGSLYEAARIWHHVTSTDGTIGGLVNLRRSAPSIVEIMPWNLPGVTEKPTNTAAGLPGVPPEIRTVILLNTQTYRYTNQLCVISSDVEKHINFY
jgi:hypothetical protein